jgi:serine/threonine-protein kinase RsbW
VTSQTIHIESRTDRLITVREFVSEAARDFGFSDEDVSKIALAVDEACTNIIKHGYKYDPTKNITIIIQRGKGTFRVVIRDSGMQFNPDDVHSPDMKEYMKHYRRGGLGIYLMKSLMDKVEYSIAPGKTNEVRLTKFLSR